MKQKMKHLISFAALLAMLVSLFSVCVFPSYAETADDYANLLNGALVVNPEWKDVAEGEEISFVYRGETIRDTFDSNFYFSSYDDAWARAVELNLSNPTIMLCAGTYNQTIYIDGAVTLIGPNAGIDPNVKSEAPNTIWSLSSARSPEANIAASIVVRKDAGSCNISFDGIRFGTGGALVDLQRSGTASEISFKNVVFSNAGNANEAYNYAVYLRSAGIARTLRLQNVYVSGQSTYGFISPFFSELYADNVAYLNSTNGFLAKTAFAQGVAPFIEINNSCFFNSSVTPSGYVISMDNQTYNITFAANGTPSDQTITSADMRPRSTLKVTGSVFYNASASSSGVFHYEFINKNSVIDMQDNYIYSSGTTTFLTPEFVTDSANTDQSSSFNIRNNRFIGTYKIPDFKGANSATYIDMSYNYFGKTNGDCVYKPVYMSKENARLIRTAFWVDPEMTITNHGWNLSIEEWPLASVDTFNYEADITAYTLGGDSDFHAVFNAGDNATVQLYTRATLDSDGVVTGVSNPIDVIDSSVLNSDPYGTSTLYAMVTNSEYPTFTPVYTITIENIGAIEEKPNFSDCFPEDYFMYQPTMAGVAAGSLVPYRWQGEIYKLTAGETLFGSVREAITYANRKGIDIPTILVPAGVYDEEMVLTGSCTILGEQHGVNPNKKPFDVITQSNLVNSAWTVNEARANSAYESTFNACIRVDKSADDFIITIDGIKMGPGCSYVDDEVRWGDNVTIFKNVYADNAGGGLDRTGAANGQLFRFWKAFGSGGDNCTMYMYDTRIDHNAQCTVFGPYFEKFVLDGVFFGNATNNKPFMASFRSRDVAEPYYSITNCYLYNNNSMSSLYMIATADHEGNAAQKTNIIYNLDNNIFYNAFAKGYGAMEINFTGTNMKFYMTNNTLVDTGGNTDTFLACTTGSSRFKGTCGSEDCSEMIICKGNRLVSENRIPLTNGTGNGTMFDYSGNYFAGGISASTGLLPDAALRFGVTEGNTGNYTYEQCTRAKIDYTFLDWDMTVRSDDDSINQAVYELNSGMFGTGTYDYERYDGMTQLVYRDEAPASCTVYANPFSVGEYSVATIEKLVNGSRTTVSEMVLDQPENIFYVTVSSKNLADVQQFVVIVTRQMNNACDLTAFDGFLVDQEARKITAYVDTTIYTYRANSVTVSNGATFELYSDPECTKVYTSRMFILFSPLTLYFKVTSEDQLSSKIYELHMENLAADQIPVAALSSVDGATYVGDNVYETSISVSVPEFTFKPVPYTGASVKVYQGETELEPLSDGSYTIANTGSEQSLRLSVTSGNGENTVDYTLRILVVESNLCELLSVENATKTGSGYLLNLGLANTTQIHATVSGGASYAVYSDYYCTELCENNIFTVLGTSSAFAYIKVTAEDGVTSAVYKVTVVTQADNRALPEITGTAGGQTYNALLTGLKEYTIYLPAGTNQVTLSGEMKDVATGCDVTFFADSAMTIPVTDAVFNLDQKITKVYVMRAAGNRTYKLPDSDLVYSAAIPLSNFVVNIVSDRGVTQYNDADQIPAWAAPYVNYLNDGHYGLLRGDEYQNLNAESHITRYELAAVASRVMGLDVSKYSNVTLSYADSVAEWALPYVKAVASAKIMTGDLEVASGKLYFNGDANATREQVAKILVVICMTNDGITTDAAEYYSLHKNDIDREYIIHDFKDEDQVSEWAIPYMHMAVAKYKLMGGSREGDDLYLFGQNYITRAEVAKMIACLMGY